MYRQKKQLGARRCRALCALFMFHVHTQKEQLGARRCRALRVRGSGGGSPVGSSRVSVRLSVCLSARGMLYARAGTRAPDTHSCMGDPDTPPVAATTTGPSAVYSTQKIFFLFFGPLGGAWGAGGPGDIEKSRKSVGKSIEIPQNGPYVSTEAPKHV